MMIHNVEFQPVKNRFLSKLKQDVETMKNNKELLINADKSSNIYKMDKDTYNKYLTENINKTYKKSNRNKVNKINIEARKIATKVKIDDRVQQFHEAEAFITHCKRPITVKDHKDNFPNFPAFRLIKHSNRRLVTLGSRFLTRSIMH